MKKTSRKPQPRKQPAGKSFNLALQGGGSHGAYTWGVLDRLLEEKDLRITGISGTSAGAINAAVMVNGYVKGGRDGAKEKLHDFWRVVADVGAFSPLKRTPIERSGWNYDHSPAYFWLDLIGKVMSPYDLNPLNINPLKHVLEQTLDIDALKSCTDINLFVTATHVESGQARVFDCSEMDIPVILASTCLPQMFQAVEVDGEYYWDGGYMGNPAIWPLIYHAPGEDVVLVQLNPIHRKGVPKTSIEIMNRLNEITFNSSLIAEMRAIEFVKRLLADGAVSHDRYKDIKMHLIYSHDELLELNVSSKLNTEWAFFKYLHEVGRNAAQQWLGAHKGDIGKRSTVNIEEKFLCGPPAKALQHHLPKQKKSK